MRTALTICLLLACLQSHAKLFGFLEDFKLKNFSWIQPNNANERMLKDPKQTQCVDLNDGYDLYIRRICGSGNGQLRGNCEDVSGIRWEIQYLLVSKQKKKNLIYITTIPPFRLKYEPGKPLIYTQPVFDDPTFVNLWYANTFHFGTLDEATHTVSLTDKEGVQDFWEYSWQGNDFVINKIADMDKKPRYNASYDLNADMPFAVKFVKQANFDIGVLAYHTYNDVQNGNAMLPLVKNKKIYIGKDCGKSVCEKCDGKGYTIFFELTRPHPCKKQSWMYFGENRVKYKPDILNP